VARIAARVPIVAWVTSRIPALREPVRDHAAEKAEQQGRRELQRGGDADSGGNCR